MNLEDPVRSEEVLRERAPQLLEHLQAALQQRASGNPVSASSHPPQTPLPPAGVWVERLLKGADNGGTLVVCRGVSCSSVGGVYLHEALIDILREGGVDVAVREEHCLEQCDRGPTFAIDDFAFTCAREECVDDERTWR